MAAKNSVKTYSENSFYHIYNRGVEKRNIFLEEQDYAVFLSYLKTYLSPKEENLLRSIISLEKASNIKKDEALKLLKLKNYSDSISLACYSLLPNHFHLLIKQKENKINYFMNSIGTRYGMYFNRKYKRTGVLFQDVYKAVLVETDEQLLHLSRYIHLNPLKYSKIPLAKWRNSPYPSSLPEYLDERKTDWLKTNLVLDYFSKTNQKNSYLDFLDTSQDLTPFSNLTIDLEDDEF